MDLEADLNKLRPLKEKLYFLDFFRHFFCPLTFLKSGGLRQNQFHCCIGQLPVKMYLDLLLVRGQRRQRRSPTALHSVLSVRLFSSARKQWLLERCLFLVPEKGKIFAGKKAQIRQTEHFLSMNGLIRRSSH